MKPSIVKIKGRNAYSDIPGEKWGDALKCAPYVWKANKSARTEVRKEKYTQYIPTFWQHDPYWLLALMLDIDMDAFKKEIAYNCELVKSNTYQQMVPIGIFTKDDTPYKDALNQTKVQSWITDMMFDADWNDINKRCPLFYGGDYCACEIIEDATRAYLGHGTYFFGDGHARAHHGIVKLSNGDLLLVIFWMWYNK